MSTSVTHCRMWAKLAAAAKHFGVSIHTIHHWRQHGKIVARKQGDSGKYLYDLDSFIAKTSCSTEKEQKRPRKGIIYARVSTRKQAAFLQNQIDRLKERYPDHDVYSDVASGINFKRKGFKKVLARCMSGGVSEVCIAHKDRLCRFAYDLVELVLKRNNTRIVVMEKQDSEAADDSAERELGDDIISIVTVFGARLHGARGGRKKKGGSSGGKKRAQEDGEGGGGARSEANASVGNGGCSGDTSGAEESADRSEEDSSEGGSAMLQDQDVPYC